LAAKDTSLSVLGATAVPASFVKDQLAETQSRCVVLVLDCCYSGAFARGAGARGVNTVHVDEEFAAGSGCIVLTASSATEYSFEGENLTQAEGRPSIFTTALVNGLATGDADLDADGEISIDELYRYTYHQVRKLTPDQTPTMWSFGIEGSVTIARSVRPARLPNEILTDLASDRVVLRLAAVEGLERILRTGRPGLKGSALTALHRVRDHDDSTRVRTAAAQALMSISTRPAKEFTPVETVGAIGMAPTSHEAVPSSARMPVAPEHTQDQQPQSPPRPSAANAPDSAQPPGRSHHLGEPWPPASTVQPHPAPTPSISSSQAEPSNAALGQTHTSALAKVTLALSIVSVLLLGIPGAITALILARKVERRIHHQQHLTGDRKLVRWSRIISWACIIIYATYIIAALIVTAAKGNW